MGIALRIDNCQAWMKYLLIALSLTAVLADLEHAEFPDPFSFLGEDTSVDSFLEQSVDTELPCTIKPCFPVCKQKTLYMSFGLFKIPYAKNVCTPASSCINANKACQALLIKTIQRAQAQEKKVKASYSAAKMAHANSATKAKAAKAAKAEAAAAAKAMDAAKKRASAKTAQYGAAVKEFNQANALKNAKKKTMDAAVAQYEHAKKSHLKAVAAMHSANGAAAKALADFRAKAKAHCDSEALHAQLVRSLGHAKLATKNCKKFGGSGPYTKIADAKDCCRTNGAAVGSVKNNGAAHPANCEAACSANQKCKYFSHSLKWKNCVLCSSCKWSGAPGNGQYYTSWTKTGV